MLYMVEELHGDWRKVGTPDVKRDVDAVREACGAAGMYRVKLTGSPIWHYFWLPANGRLEPMDN